MRKPLKFAQQPPETFLLYFVAVVAAVVVPVAFVLLVYLAFALALFVPCFDLYSDRFAVVVAAVVVVVEPEVSFVLKQD